MTIDLSTKYLGLKLKNPLAVSACPLTGELDVLRRLEEHGAAAVVLPSLFEEQLEENIAAPPEGCGSRAAAELMESAAYFNELKEYNRGPDAYLRHITAAKEALSIPVIGSMNAVALGDWVHFAKQIEAAGADAMELNVYFLVTDLETTSREVEARYVDLVAAVRQEISIPLAVKIGPYFTALPNMARRLVDAGADGLVLFNRYLQPDIDLEAMRVVPRLTLSSAEEMRNTLRWTALLHGRIEASLAATTGVHFADDVVRMLLAGADVVMVASTLYRHGVDVLQHLVEGLTYWLETREYSSLDQVRGLLSQRRCADPSAFARANYTKAISSYATGSEAVNR